MRRVDLPPGQRYIALTFDLCEQPPEVAGYQGDIIDYLRRENVRATFFAGGKWMLTHAERAQQLMADPLFEVGNHTWEHRNLRLLNGSALEDEIWNASIAYRKVRGMLAARKCLDRVGKREAALAAPKQMTLFRFPFGACDAKSLRAVEAAGLRAIQWDLSSSDPSQSVTAEAMVRDVMQRARPGSIVLFHANGRGWHTGQALPRIVRALKESGYKFATVSELLRLPGAKPVAGPLCYDVQPGDTDRYDGLARTLAAKHESLVARLKRQPARMETSRTQDVFTHPLQQAGKAPQD